MVDNGDKIAVWFSCGAASAVAAKLTLELFGDRCEVRIVNSPVIEEDEDNRRFARDVAEWLGVEIEIAVNENYPSCSAVEVWKKRKFMSSPYGAPCTLELKKEARRQWEDANPVDWHVLGFTADETHRHERFVMSERSNLLPVLIDAGIDKADCFRILDEAGVRMPRIYSLGFPNANCKGCVKATSPAYWNLVRKHYPSSFRRRAKQSREIGAKLVRFKGKRIFLDQLPKDAGKLSKVRGGWSCGIFCDPEPFSVKAEECDD